MARKSVEVEVTLTFTELLEKLRAAKREGVTQEQARIITLLEDENCNIRISCTDEVVALIKGDNK